GRGGPRLPRPRRLTLRQEAQVRRVEVRDLREYGGDVGRGEAVPLRERRRVLVDGRRGDEAAEGPRVVGTGEGERRPPPDEVAALHRTSQHELAASPPVVRAQTVGAIGAAEVGAREERDL